jgi:hypothetical protein
MSTCGLFGLGKADPAYVPGALLAIGLAISAGRVAQGRRQIEGNPSQSETQTADGFCSGSQPTSND